LAAFSVNAADKSKARCELNDGSVSRSRKTAKSYNTSNLHKHLLTQHPEQHMALQQIEKEQAQAKTKL